MVCGDRVAPEIEEQKTLVEFDMSSVRWSTVLSRADLGYRPGAMAVRDPCQEGCGHHA